MQTLDPRLEQRRAIFAELIRLGVRSTKAEYIAREYPPELIERQIAWLPYRLGLGQTPGIGLLVRSIEQDFPRPPLAPIIREGN